ncbi:MAG: hypothetical protein HY811_10550 [Planctomycetes bacterium]|nr:hypothetical protein [Planctomycetota bacterium]
MPDTPNEKPSTFPKWPLYLTILFGLIVGVFYSMDSMTSATIKHKPIQVGPYTVEITVRDNPTLETPVTFPLVVTSEKQPREVKLVYYSLNKEEAYPTMVHKLPPKEKELSETDMQPAGKSGFYVAKLPPLGMAEMYYYNIKLTDENGQSFNLHEKNANIVYKRKGISIVTLIHFVLMVMVIFFLFHAIYYALMHIATNGGFTIKKAFNNVFWSTLFFFITSFPIGCWVSYNAYGNPWTGIPIVWDPNDVDNKSLGIFIYWLIIILLLKGLDKGKNKIGTKAFAWLSLLGSILTILLFITGGHR